jgi:hypothetical protein
MYKKLIIVCIVMLLSFTLTSSAKLVAYYPFDGNLNDASGNGWDGTVSDGNASFTAGKIGQALDMDGSYYVEMHRAIASALNIDGAKPRTAMAWVFVKTTPEGNPQSSIWSIGSSGVGSSNFRVAPGSGINNPGTEGSNLASRGSRFPNSTNQFTLAAGPAPNYWALFIGPLIGQMGPMQISKTIENSNDQWIHLAEVYDGTNLFLYANGLTVPYLSQVTGYNLGGETPLQIGARASPMGNILLSGAISGFMGLIDDVQIWDEALTPAQIRLLMEGYKNRMATPLNPHNGAINIMPDILSWTAGKYAVAHNVYFGTDSNVVDSNSTKPVSSYQSATTYKQGKLDTGKTYYWRIDEVNAPGTAGSYINKGQVWKFTTAIPAPKTDINDKSVKASMILKELKPADIDKIEIYKIDELTGQKSTNLISKPLAQEMVQGVLKLCKEAATFKGTESVTNTPNYIMLVKRVRGDNLEISYNDSFNTLFGWLESEKLKQYLYAITNGLQLNFIIFENGKVRNVSKQSYSGVINTNMFVSGGVTASSLLEGGGCYATTDPVAFANHKDSSIGQISMLTGKTPLKLDENGQIILNLTIRNNGKIIMESGKPVQYGQTQSNSDGESGYMIMLISRKDYANP